MQVGSQLPNTMGSSQFSSSPVNFVIQNAASSKFSDWGCTNLPMHGTPDFEWPMLEYVSDVLVQTLNETWLFCCRWRLNVDCFIQIGRGCRAVEYTHQGGRSSQGKTKKELCVWGDRVGYASVLIWGGDRGDMSQPCLTYPVKSSGIYFVQITQTAKMFRILFQLKL